MWPRHMNVATRSHILAWNGEGTDSLQWRHNGHDSVSNHQPNDCLLNRLFRRRSKKTSKLRVTGLYGGNSHGTGEFPAQMTSNAENVYIWWRHHVSSWCQSGQRKPSHWNEYIFILMKFSSLAGLEIIKMTTFSLARDKNFVKITTFSFRCVTVADVLALKGHQVIKITMLIPRRHV